jgi:hypothetical protein
MLTACSEDKNPCLHRHRSGSSARGGSFALVTLGGSLIASKIRLLFSHGSANMLDS